MHASKRSCNKSAFNTVLFDTSSFNRWRDRRKSLNDFRYMALLLVVFRMTRYIGSIAVKGLIQLRRFRDALLYLTGGKAWTISDIWVVFRMTRYIGSMAVKGLIQLRRFRDALLREAYLRSLWFGIHNYAHSGLSEPKSSPEHILSFVSIFVTVYSPARQQKLQNETKS